MGIQVHGTLEIEWENCFNLLKTWAGIVTDTDSVVGLEKLYILKWVIGYKNTLESQ